MSIIHDALKKVQEKNAKGMPAHPPVSTPPSAAQVAPPPVKEPLQENRTLIILLGTLIVGIVIWAIISNIPKHPSEQITIIASQIPIKKTEQSISQPMRAAPGSPTKPAEPAVVPAAPAVPAKPQVDPNDPLSSLRVEGIMDMGGKKAALLNGNIYEEGQTIYGRIIAQITLDSVTIVDDGKKRTFAVNPPKP